MQIQPYLFFEGRCEEAAEFYKSALGAEVTMLMRFKDAPPAPEGSSGPGCGPDAPNAEKVMHMALNIGGATILASDGHAAGNPEFKGFGLSLTASSVDEATRMYEALSAGGHAMMPMGPTFFAKAFGMVADKFGVMWMVMAEM